MTMQSNGVSPGVVESSSTAGQITINGAANTSNCVTSGYISYPYYPGYYYPTNDITIRKVANGWVLCKNGQEFILNKAEDVLQYLKEK